MEQQVAWLERKVYYLLRRRFNMRVAICDDEKVFREDLIKKVYEYSNIHRLEMVVDGYSCGEDLILSRIPYDIIFLDYKMGGLDGLDTARKLREKNLSCSIIFLTNYPHFVYESFEVNTFRFFEKPLEKNKLHKAFDDYFKKYGNDYPVLLKCNREILNINTKDIVFLEADNKSCIIHLVDEIIRCSKTMATISKLMPEDHFHKVNRAFIVNLNYIRKYDNDEITFKNGEKVHISRNYLTPFKTEYRKYSRNRFI